ncbi:tetratricopeptide repeat protein [Sphingomonas sp. HF-S4]|uniref:Tetratricopeptide repeat protein n=1 Tax=Sphingomonas agrestis TaxID=3080540 RepID=A0ABU3Y4G1_9SPHN|nr:tetratricopeptide repeat protein [Sphingomonas sp. HF-S4]MDV3456285.1 tetratricopeptide repeat protein [Sphingomonas sp. HF-S4]
MRGGGFEEAARRVAPLYPSPSSARQKAAKLRYPLPYQGERKVWTKFRYALGLALLFAAAPATAQTAFDPSGYVRARAADDAGAAHVAAAGYAEALAAAPDDATVALRAYRQALAAGDYTLASRAGAVLVRAGGAPPDTALLALAVALRSGDAAGAGRAVEAIARGPFDFLAPSLRAWLAFDRGEDGVALLDAAPGDALARRYTRRHRALLLIAAKRTDEAMAALAADLATADRDDTRIDAALLLARVDKREPARRLLAADRPDFERLRKKLPKRTRPDAAFGASRMFLELAVEVADEEMAQLSILLTRAALLLDPRDDRARLFLAEALSQGGSHDLALSILAEVGRHSPFVRGAASGRIAVLRRADRLPEALQLAQTMAQGSEATRADAETLGDLLADQGRDDLAAAAYAAGLKDEGATDWRLHYLHGRALDRAGRWDEALPALQRAVTLGPEQAPALKYLGTAWIARGENLTAAQTLLERARSLAPDDAEIADSLAWAYYQRGDVARALPMLERAVRDDPAAARANEHLGDAYWRLGRHYEARYAWRAAALTAENDAPARLEAKLANGLKPQPN